MCLSTVIQVADGESREVCSQVSSAEVGEGVVTFTDIMGIKTEVAGTITSIDLVDNRIYVSA